MAVLGFPGAGGQGVLLLSPQVDLTPAVVAAGLGYAAPVEARAWQEQLRAVLADPDLYARDAVRFRATTDALAVAREDLAAAEERWLRLEMLREELEAAEPRS